LALKRQIAELPALLLGESAPEVKEEAVKKAAKHFKAAMKFLKEQETLLKLYCSAYEKLLEAESSTSNNSEDNPDECGDEQEEDPVA
jgi:phage terminase small subunit